LVEEGTRVRALAFSPDGRWLAAGMRTGEINFWDTENHRHIVRKAHLDEVKGVAFKSDGKTLFSCSKDKTLKVWSTPEWAEVWSFQLGNYRQAVACDVQGRMLACSTGVWGTSDWHKVFEMSSVEAGEQPFKIHRLLQ